MYIHIYIYIHTHVNLQNFRLGADHAESLVFGMNLALAGTQRLQNSAEARQGFLVKVRGLWFGLRGLGCKCTL